MADLILVEELQDYLVAQGVGQLPSAAPSTVLPSIWLVPRDGYAAPRTSDGEKCAITLVDSNLTGPPEMAGWIEETFVQVVVRHVSNPACKLVLRQIRGLIHPIGDLFGRKQWTMGQLPVEYSTVWREEQPLPFADDPDRVSVARTESYRFAVRRKALKGLPLVP